jgi:hypothetical protein
VVEARPPFLQEPTDGRFVAERLDQLEPACAFADEDDGDALGLDAFRAGTRSAREAFIQWYRCGQRQHCDPYVIDG